jgi:hypothetical protein
MAFCCEQFRLNFEMAGTRGFGVFSVGRFYKDKPAFIIQHRALDLNADPPMFAPSPLSLVSEMHIQFCPWCGTQLEEFYGNSPEITKPDLKLLYP